MDVVKSTVKGQILIPATLRKKYQIERGTTLRIYEEDDRIVVEPLRQDPVVEGRGILKTQGRILKALLKERREEAER
ncbi:MAG: AbrB/MazE/SpoVT family DNA-binding domain-containing protein [Proteobacteria bacterium]|nr:AbrB/MazE/SpoVT family DNA-binding domain-containing protein [Pseudomonadota bacterium]